ncbi:hypothetical protein ACFT7S_05855 [Streptomyces sp. NPDC057136]|uniref:hypothetical protein n=1 Tax=Streptomyces sp. NPDC057136 TaxID=3346029 RepID=UPI003641DD7A
MNDVQELLGRVADEAGRSTLTTDAVYAKAARVRWRRRATVSAAALAVVAAGAVAVPQLGPEAKHSSVAASGEPVGKSGAAERLGGKSAKAARLAELLPVDAGDIEQVSLAVLLKQATPQQAKEKYIGPLDGQYSVRTDGGVGYLVLANMTREGIAKKLGGAHMPKDLCAGQPSQTPHRTDCEREVLPDGRVLTTWSRQWDNRDGGTPQWGAEIIGELTLQDGGLLTVRDSTGFDGEHAQGPLLKTPPLTSEQLRTLLLSPELLPKK